MDICLLLELCEYSANLIWVSYVQMAIFVIGMVFAALLIWQPRKVIEIQIALYRPFNWKIEPISMEKKIKNMRVMGIIIFILGVIPLIYMILFIKQL